MNAENSSNSSKEEGNTKPPPSCKKKQISPCKRWCFTWNNYTIDWESRIVPIVSKCGKYSIGDEVGGENGTPHLQGYIEFDVKCRPMSILGIKEIHWEKAKGNRIENLNYTQKEGKYIQNFEIKYKCEISKFYPWENKILKILKTKPDDRSIYWFWEPTGCAGKTTFQKYVFTHFENVIVLSGKGDDMKNGIVQYQKLNNKLPEIILINIPRASKNFISWSGIEQVKDMFFFSGKYEGGNICGPNPHLICFSNSEPEQNHETGEYLISNDRLIIEEISN